MTEYLKENLSTKKKLRFHDGRFRIIVFSDLHGIKDFDYRLFRDIRAILDKTNPDIVLINGDIVWRDGAENEDTLRAFLTELDKCFSERSIPWAHVFGNHDREKNFDNPQQLKVYEGFPFCLTKAGPDDVDGTGNYVLPVFEEDSEKILYNIWGLDSGDGISNFLEQYGFDTERRQICFQDPLHVNQGYDCIRFTQMMWFWQSDAELEKHNGSKIPGMMFFHEALPEFTSLYKNPAWTKYKGTMRENVGTGPLNSGLFAEIVQRGSVNLIVCGHDHINDFEGDILGIKLAMDAGISYDGYCDDDLRGGRVIDLTTADLPAFETYMVRAMDCVGEDYPGNRIPFECRA